MLRFNKLIDEAQWPESGLMRYKNKVYKVGKYDNDGNRALYDSTGRQVGIIRSDESFQLWSEVLNKL